MSFLDEEATTDYVCRSRCCNQPIAGLAPASGLQLCLRHLSKDVLKAEARRDKLLGKLEDLRHSGDVCKLRRDLLMMETEVRQMNKAFDAVFEKLQHWRNKVVSAIQEVQDSTAAVLQDLLRADDCSREVSAACDAGDLRTVMKLAASIEPWIRDARDRSTKFERVQAELRDRQSRQGVVDTDSGDNTNYRSIGDLVGGVRHLKFLIDKHMTDVMQQCWLDEAKPDSTANKLPVCKFVDSIENLQFCPIHLTSCTNTDGYMADASGCVVSVDSIYDDNCTALPRVCVIVALKNEFLYLLLTSIIGGERLRVEVLLDSTFLIRGLHCDSDRQLLYISQKNQLTVTDLSGINVYEIDCNSEGFPWPDFRCIGGNSDHLFVLCNDIEMVCTVDKNSMEIESAVDLHFLESKSNMLSGLAPTPYGTKLLLVDSGEGKIFKLCCISDCLISSYPNRRSGVLETFAKPKKVALDSRGLMFVAEFGGHCVRVMTNDGEILQTLGTPGQHGNSEGHFYHPTDVILIDSDENTHLVVADSDNKRLQIFKVS